MSNIVIRARVTRADIKNALQCEGKQNENRASTCLVVQAAQRKLPAGSQVSIGTCTARILLPSQEFMEGVKLSPGTQEVVMAYDRIVYHSDGGPEDIEPQVRSALLGKLILLYQGAWGSHNERNP